MKDLILHEKKHTMQKSTFLYHQKLQNDKTMENNIEDEQLLKQYISPKKSKDGQKEGRAKKHYIGRYASAIADKKDQFEEREIDSMAVKDMMKPSSELKIKIGDDTTDGDEDYSLVSLKEFKK